jgi:CHAT domain-containing protein
MAEIRASLSTAESHALAALAIAKSMGRRSAEGRDHALGQAERTVGHVRLLQGRPRVAVRHYQRSRRAFRSHPDESARTAVAMVQALAYVGEYDQAYGVAEDAIAFYQRKGEAALVARLEANVANALHRQDRLPEARVRYERALEAIRQSATTPLGDLAIVMRNYGVCLMGLGEWDVADAMYADARAQFEADGNRHLTLEIDLNRAYLFARRGRIAAALRLYRKVRRTIGDTESFEIGHCLLDQAESMLEIGLWRDALDAAARARHVFATLELRFELGKAALFEAMAAMRVGQPAIARDRLALARPRLRAERNPVWLGLLSLSLAELTDDPRRERAYLADAMSRLGTAGAEYREQAARLRLAESYLRQGMIAQATLELQSAPDRGPHALAALMLRARCARLTNPDDAEAFAMRILAEFDRVRAEAGPSVLRRAVQLAHRDALREAFRAARGLELRVQIAARLKRATFAELIESPESVSADEAVRRAREQLFAAQSRWIDGRGESERRALEARLIESARDLALDAVSAGPPNVASPATDDSTDDAHVFLEFLSDGEWIWVFRRDEQGRSEHRFAAVAEMERQARWLRMHLARALQARQPASSIATLTWFSERMAGLWPHAEGHRIVIGRDAITGAIPFHALTVPDGRVAYEVYHVRYAPNEAAYRALRPADHRCGRPVVIAASDSVAPHIADEAREVAAQLGVSDSLQLNERLDVAALQAQLARASIVHLAAHGVQREDRPMLNALRIGGGEFTAFDLGGLKIRAALVTLSGCGTGLAGAGLGSDAEDAEGFVEALWLAGASDVLASLWPVEDASTRHWMRVFYAELIRSGDSDIAYRLACDAIRSLHPNPAFWAAFAMFGKPAKISVCFANGQALESDSGTT